MDKIFSKEEIYSALISDIVLLKIKPGDTLKEAELSSRFKVSRTPFREVIKQMAFEGYVKVVPRHGNIVTLIDQNKVRQLVEMRAVLETAVEKQLLLALTEAQIAELKDNLSKQELAIAENDTNAFWELDNAFHESLFCFAGKSVWWETLKRYEAHYMRFRKLEMTDNTNYELLFVHHKQILKNLIERKVEDIESTVRAHVGFCLQRLPVLMDKYPSYFVGE